MQMEVFTPPICGKQRQLSSIMPERKRKIPSPFYLYGISLYGTFRRRLSAGHDQSVCASHRYEAHRILSCENPMVQKLYENQVWGQKSNYVEVPTDCPQRDERMGYTGDGQVFARTGAYNFDTNDFWKNFLRDLELGQLDNTEGYVCHCAADRTCRNWFYQHVRLGKCGHNFTGNALSAVWRRGSTATPVREHETFVEAEIRKMGKKNLWIGPSLGDWLAMGKGIAWQAMHNNPVSNAFIVHDLKVISETAERLGKKS